MNNKVPPYIQLSVAIVTTHLINLEVDIVECEFIRILKFMIEWIRQICHTKKQQYNYIHTVTHGEGKDITLIGAPF